MKKKSKKSTKEMAYGKQKSVKEMAYGKQKSPKEMAYGSGDLRGSMKKALRTVEEERKSKKK